MEEAEDLPIPTLESDRFITPFPDVPVGGRLLKFSKIWGTFCRDKWVLDVIERGYRMEFLEITRFGGIVKSPIPLDKVSRDLLLGEVTDMLAKSAIRRVPFNPRSGFYSRIFLAPKKNGKWRPVINLKPLNQFLKKQHFKMSTIADVIQEVERDDWLISIDLKDAYFHVPIHPSVEIRQILCRGGDVRIQSLTLWGNDGSQDLHQDDGASGRVHQKGDRVVHVSIPGRLLGERQGKIVLGLQIRENGPVHARCRAKNQLGEIGANAFPGYRPYRTEAHDQSGHGIGTRRSDCGHNRVSQDDPGEDDDFGSIVSQAARVSEQRHTPSGVGQVIPASDTDLSPVILETQYGIPGRSHSSPQFTQGPSEMVAEQGKSSEGVTVVSIDLESRACDRREYGGLGSLSSLGRRNQGSVVGPGEGTSYQLPGDAGGVPSLDVFQSDVESGGCNPSEKRQYDGGDIREQARGNEVVHTLLPDVGAAQLVSRSPVEDSGGIRTGGEKCPGGPILKEGTSSRVVIVSDGSRESVSAVESA